MGKTARIVLTISVIWGVLCLFPLPVLAVPVPPPPPPPPPPPQLTWDKVVDILTNTLNILLGSGAAVALFMLVAGGLMYITSSGDKQAVETAKKTLTYAVIGMIVTFGAITIVQIVRGWVGR